METVNDTASSFYGDEDSASCKIKGRNSLRYASGNRTPSDSSRGSGSSNRRQIYGQRLGRSSDEILDLSHKTGAEYTASDIKMIRGLHIPRNRDSATSQYSGVVEEVEPIKVVVDRKHGGPGFLNEVRTLDSSSLKRPNKVVKSRRASDDLSSIASSSIGKLPTFIHDLEKTPVRREVVQFDSTIPARSPRRPVSGVPVSLRRPLPPLPEKESKRFTFPGTLNLDERFQQLENEFKLFDMREESREPTREEYVKEAPSREGSLTEKSLTEGSLRGGSLTEESAQKSKEGPADDDGHTEESRTRSQESKKEKQTQPQNSLIQPLHINHMRNPTSSSGTTFHTAEGSQSSGNSQFSGSENIQENEDDYEDIEDEEPKTKPKSKKRFSTGSQLTKKPPFDMKTLAKFLDATEGMVIGQEFEGLGIPQQERRLVEKVVDSLSRLSTRMILEPETEKEGIKRLEKALKALDGFD